MYAQYILAGLVLGIVIVERVTNGATQARRWITGLIVIAFNSIVLVSLTCLVIMLSVAAPTMKIKADFLSRYAEGAGALSAAEKGWLASGRRFSLGYRSEELESIDDIQYPKERLESLLGILEHGATVGVRRGTVGAILRFDSILHERFHWQRRFLDGLNILTGQTLRTVVDAKAWYQTVADDPEWRAVALVRNLPN